MTDFQPLISAVPVVIGGLLTILGALAVQRMTTEREREARIHERDVRRAEARDRFQAKTLMAAQRVAARAADHATSAMVLQPDNMQAEEDVAPWTAAMNSLERDRNELDILRERIQDDECREKLKVLSANAFNHGTGDLEQQFERGSHP